MLNFFNHKDKVFTLLASLVAFSLSLGIEFYNVSMLLFFLVFIVKIWPFKEVAISNLKRDYNLSYALFLVLLGISLFYTKNIQNGFSEILKYVHFFAWGLVFTVLKNNIHLRYVCLAFILGVVFTSLNISALTLIHISENNESFDLFFTHYHRNFLFNIIPNMMQPMYLSVYILLAWLFSFFILNKKTGILKYLLFGVLSVYLFFMLYILSSKVVAMFLLFFLLVVIFSKILKTFTNRQNKSYAFILTALVCFALFHFRLELADLFYGEEETVFWHQNFADRLKFFLEHGDSSRLDNWKTSLSVMFEHPLLGVGIGDVLDVLQASRDKNSWAYLFNANTHNQYLSIAVSTGCLGLFSFLVFLRYLFLRAASSQNFIFFGLVILFLVFMFVENVLDRHAGITLFAFFLFLFLNNTKSLNKTAQ